MQDLIRASIQGFVKISDKTTGEILVDTHNDVLYGNMSMALAHALIGNSGSFLYYMAFGNGGAYVGPTGMINYKDTRGEGAAGLVKNPNANLYSTVYVKKLSNDATDTAQYNDKSRAYIAAEDYATMYEDIIVDVTIDYTEPPVGITEATAVTQTVIDNSTFVGTSADSTGTATTFNPANLVFNEIGLFAGSNDLFVGNYTATVEEVNNFVMQGVNYTPGSKSKLMLTHVIFHPVQKSANRSLEIVYTLRIQMGAR